MDIRAAFRYIAALRIHPGFDHPKRIPQESLRCHLQNYCRVKSNTFRSLRR
jgi:hypothetical protein